MAACTPRARNPATVVDDPKARSRLVLMRHAKSDYPAGTIDHDRPLSPRGQRNAAAMGIHLAQILGESPQPYGVGVSTAIRAQQTWGLVAPNVEEPSERWNDRALYLAPAHSIIEIAEAGPVATLVIGGHNPGLELVAAMADGAGDALDRSTGRRLGDGMPTSSITVMESPTPWRMTTARISDFRICR